MLLNYTKGITLNLSCWFELLWQWSSRWAPCWPCSDLVLTFVSALSSGVNATQPRCMGEAVKIQNASWASTQLTTSGRLKYLYTYQSSQYIDLLVATAPLSSLTLIQSLGPPYAHPGKTFKTLETGKESHPDLFSLHCKHFWYLFSEDR